MNEELTPLEAFERIKNSLDYHKSYAKDILPTKAKIIDEEDKDELQIIENALKEYELMKNTKFIVADKKVSNDDLEKLKNQRMFVGNLEQCEIKPLFDEETTKKLKALEIIKEKELSTYELWLIKNDYSWETYVETMEELHWGDKYLNKVLKTHEEFDLLKEVLKND